MKNYLKVKVFNLYGGSTYWYPSNTNYIHEGASDRELMIRQQAINAAINIGIDKDDAIKLVEGTLVGSASLLENSEEEVSKLRKAVTSPNGTTEAGLSILSNNDSFFNLIRNAIEGAQKRGKELGKL